MLIPILFSRKARSGTTSAILNRAEDFRKALDLMHLTLVPREAVGICKPLLLLASWSFTFVRPVMSIDVLPTDEIN
jgi:hypothetical protein